MSKVTVVGAGNVGATCANVLAVKNIASEVVLIDIKEGVAEGKAMDIMQTAQLLGFNTVVRGVTSDYSQTAGSDVVVITSGIPRKPGMTREELIGVNAGIVKSVANQVLAASPNAILVVVSNPMDTMAYLTLKATGLPKNRVIGMGGALDSSRFKYFLSQKLKCAADEVEGFVIGGHGDTTMIPMARFAAYKGIPVCALLEKDEMDEVVHNTMVGGATLTGLLGTSAWLAPGARAASVGCYHQRPQTYDPVLRTARRRIRIPRYLYRCALYHRPQRYRRYSGNRTQRQRERTLCCVRGCSCQNYKHPPRN